MNSLIWGTLVWLAAPVILICYMTWLIVQANYLKWKETK